MARLGASQKLRRLRLRFGINAPKVAIKTHVEWYWQMLAVFTVLAVSLLAVGWIYGAGKYIAGGRGDESLREVQALRNHLIELDAEVTKLRALVGVGESSLQIERATQRHLASELRALETENAALKEDLAFFENLLPVSEQKGDGGVRVENLRINPVGELGEYRYRMFLVCSADRAVKEFKGVVQFLVRMKRSVKDATIDLPVESVPVEGAGHLESRRYLRVEGGFSVPPRSLVEGVEARILQDGVVRAKVFVTL